MEAIITITSTSASTPALSPTMLETSQALWGWIALILFCALLVFLYGNNEEE